MSVKGNVANGYVGQLKKKNPSSYVLMRVSLLMQGGIYIRAVPQQGFRVSWRSRHQGTFDFLLRIDDVASSCF